MIVRMQHNKQVFEPVTSEAVGLLFLFKRNCPSQICVTGGRRAITPTLALPSVAGVPMLSADAPSNGRQLGVCSRGLRAAPSPNFPSPIPLSTASPGEFCCVRVLCSHFPCQPALCFHGRPTPGPVPARDTSEGNKKFPARIEPSPPSPRPAAASTPPPPGVTPLTAREPGPGERRAKLHRPVRPRRSARAEQTQQLSQHGAAAQQHT